MIISLHMPKCGGSSFRKLLKDHFKLRFSSDYEYPMHLPVSKREKKVQRARRRVKIWQKYFFGYRYTQCIHGHFMPYKYEYLLGMEGVIFVTWLRDPIERLISHYDFWQRSYPNNRHPKQLHKRVVEEGWTLKEFAFSKELQNFYTKYLWNFPIRNFDFIGLTEYYDEDFTYFADHFMGLNQVSVPQKNVSPSHNKPQFEDEKIIEELKAFHADDYELYEQVREARKQRFIQS